MSFAEEFDRNNFMQNIILGRYADCGYSYGKSENKRPTSSGTRTALGSFCEGITRQVKITIWRGGKLVKNLADIRSKDFVTCVDQHSIVLIKDVSHIKEEEMEERLSKIAGSLADNLHMEAMIRVRVGYGNVVTQLPEIAESYQEARMALEVGRVFYAKYDTISYGKLGIGRLIYQLPMSLCNMFIKEVFGEKIPDILDDEEAMSTINKFFENNLNISETARQLYVHRNTLVYRLERIEKAIGLDIRTFDDAMTFRIAVMVIAHMRDQM